VIATENDVEHTDMSVNVFVITVVIVVTVWDDPIPIV
jgi:hypothetical protein